MIEKIVIYGGYDVCICGISSLTDLKYLNADVEYCIARKENQSYDLDEDIIIKNQSTGVFLGAGLLITVGSGLKSKEVEKFCRECNIDLIVTENKRKKSVYDGIYINPSEEKSLYRYKDISQSGVTLRNLCKL